MLELRVYVMNNFLDYTVFSVDSPGRCKVTIPAMDGDDGLVALTVDNKLVGKVHKVPAGTYDSYELAAILWAKEPIHTIKSIDAYVRAYEALLDLRDYEPEDTEWVSLEDAYTAWKNAANEESKRFYATVFQWRRSEMESLLNI